MQTCDNLNINDVYINSAELNKAAVGTFIPIRSRNRLQIIIQTPKIFAPFGASSFRKAETLADGKIPKYDVQLSLDPSDKKLAKLSDFLCQLDTLVCRSVAQNNELLQLLNVKTINKKTGKSKSIEEIQEDLENNRYNSIVKIKDPKYPPLFKLSISRDAKTHTIELYCQNGKETVQLDDDNIDNIFHKSIQCKCVFVISHIWIVSNRFGVTLKLKRCKLFPQNPDTYAFVSSSDDDNNDHNTSNNKKKKNQDEEREEELCCNSSSCCSRYA